jgi:hypothetical protein
MSIALVHKQTTVGGGSSLTLTNTNTAGDLLVVCFRGATSVTVSDNASSHGGSSNNTWLTAVNLTNGGNGVNIRYVPNCQGTTTPMVITFSGNTPNALSYAEYSGLALTSGTVLGSTASAKFVTNGTTYAVAGVSTSNPSVLVIGAVENETANSLTDTPSGGFTDLQSSDGNLFMATQISGAGTYTYGGVLSSSVAWAAAVAIFNAPVVANAGPSFMQYGFGF